MNYCDLFLFSVSPEVHLLKHFKADTIIVRKNEPVEIPANVIGLPIPKIEWSKDDVVIEQSTETLLIDTEVTGRMNAKTTLSIPAVNRRDRGSYTVTASNNMGSAKHTVFVMVLGELTHCTQTQNKIYCSYVLNTHLLFSQTDQLHPGI